MRSPGRGRHARSFFSKLCSRLSFRRLIPVHRDDRAPQSPSSTVHHTLSAKPTSASTSVVTLTSSSPSRDHGCRPKTCLNFTAPPSSALPITSQSLGQLFQAHALFLGCKPTKMPGIIVLDTGAETNVMSSEMVKRLGLPLRTIEPYNLVPVHSDARHEPGLTVQHEVEVEWHFFNGGETYTTRFVVLDMPNYDILLGREDIRRYELLVPGPALPLQWGVTRSLEEGWNPPYNNRQG